MSRTANPRRKAYLADITYGTNNEFGFDYLRDNMVHSPDEMVQRKHHFAMVDEVDSVLIDDARTPLIISGSVPKGDDQQYHILIAGWRNFSTLSGGLSNQFLIEAKKKLAEGNDDPKDCGLALMRSVAGITEIGAADQIPQRARHQGKVAEDRKLLSLRTRRRRWVKVDAELYFHIDEKNNSVDPHR